MAKEREIELAELVRLLVALFPNQHPKCASWLQAIRSVAPVAARPDQSPRRTGKPSNAPPPRPAISARPPEVQPAPAREETPPVAKPPRRPAAPPSFAKELTATVAEWRDRHPGNEISWDKETERRDAIASKAGLTDWKEGWNATIPSVMADVELGPQQSVSVEVVIPRTVDFQSVLIGAGHKGMPKRFFEISIDELTIGRIRELGTYVLATGARQ